MAMFQVHWNKQLYRSHSWSQLVRQRQIVYLQERDFWDAQGLRSFSLFAFFVFGVVCLFFWLISLCKVSTW